MAFTWRPYCNVLCNVAPPLCPARHPPQSSFKGTFRAQPVTTVLASEACSCPIATLDHATYLWSM
jgi:hypothetical protein